jgi:putative membrane protein
MWWDHPWGPGWFFGFPFMPLVFIAVCILIMVFVMMPMMRRWHGGGTERTALDILDERFARGEIDRAEYDEKRRAIAGR